MATPVINKIEAGASGGLSWIQKHERILIVGLVLAASAIGFNAYLNGSAAKAEAKAAALQLIVDNDKQIINKLNDQNAANEKATSDAKIQYQQIIDTLERQNSSLATAVTARNNQLQQTQTSIQTAPLDDVAKTIIMAAKLQPLDLTVSGSIGTISQPGMRQIASELVKIPVLEANLTDTATVAANRQSELNKANEVISTQSIQVVGLNNTITALNGLVADSEKACNAKIDAVKKDARKSKVKWFLAGIATGAAIVARLVI
jgi:hypothetical protein